MYLHIGNGMVVREAEILGIFDLENTSLSKATREFLAQAEKEKRVVNVTMEMPKAFVVAARREQRRPSAGRCVSGLKTVVYITQVSAGTLRGRLRSSQGIKSL